MPSLSPVEQATRQLQSVATLRRDVMNQVHEPDEAIIERFEAAWSDGAPSIEDFATRIEDASLASTLKELVIIDLEFRWKNHSAIVRDGGTSAESPPGLESYLERFPQLNTPHFVEHLVTEAFTIRHRYGDRVSLDSFVLRFPEWEEVLKATQAELQASETKPGARPTIANYQLLKEVGKGGMGSVYMAQQLAPVRRMVAVKVIRNGMDSAEVIRRFEAERQALAMMDHPNISRVLDAGATEDGLPYFAMEFVDGIPITDYCEQEKLGVSKRLRIFSDICAAVQHAHQKGVLHRDLKPSNVLIADQNGKPVVKVIDFGLAKAIDNTAVLSDQSIRTYAGQIIGTLKYMSPEQAVTANADVDTRADVYALGAILYELLTGETPLDDESLQNRGILAILELIQNHEPVRPSVRFQNNDAAGTISNRLSTSVSALRQQLQGDLDWVVMKALEKERSRRYDSASSLADDVKRFLDHEPVIARPPSTTYRLGKLVRKNRFLVGAVAAFTVLLIVGISATTWQAVRAMIAEKEAVRLESIAVANAQTADQERREAERLRDAESEAKQRAESSAQRAEQILDFITNSFRSANPLRGARKDMKARDVLLHAFHSVDDVSEDSASRAELCLSLGKSFHGLGDDSNAIKAALAAKSLFDQSGDSEKSVEANNLIAQSLLARGDGYRAWDVYSQSFAQLQTIASGQAKSRAAFLSSSSIMVDTLIGIAEATVSPSADMLAMSGDSARAAVAASERFYGKTHPQTIRAHWVLATATEVNGKPTEAIQLYEALLMKLQAEADKQPGVEAQVRLKFAEILLRIGDGNRAIVQVENAVEILTGEFGAEHSSTMRAQCQLAECLATQSMWSEGLALLSVIQTQFNSQDPSYRKAARLYVRRLVTDGRTDEAERLCTGSFADETWIHIVNGAPESATQVLSGELERETDPRQRTHLLKRIFAMKLWTGDAQTVASLPPDDRAAIETGKTPRIRDFFRLSELWQMMIDESWNNLKVPAEELASRSSDKSISLLAGWTAQYATAALAPEKAQATENVATAFDELNQHRFGFPDYLRWTITQCAQRTATLYAGVEAEQWRDRAEDLQNELREFTLNERFDRTLLDSEPKAEKRSPR